MKRDPEKTIRKMAWYWGCDPSTALSRLRDPNYGKPLPIPVKRVAIEELSGGEASDGRA